MTNWVEDLNYLNMQEIKKVCAELSILYKIYYELDGKVRLSGGRKIISSFLEEIKSVQGGGRRIFCSKYE